MVEGSSHIVIRDSVLRGNKSFGVKSHGSSNVTIDGNDITRNAVGVHIGPGNDGTRVTGNRVHHNDKMLVNSPRSVNAHDDAGGEGIAFVRSTGRVLVKGNRIWGNRARSHDYGWDGGALGVFGASNLTITDNVLWDNRNILETGTDPGRTPCANNVFARNVAYGATTVDRTVGMVLRCAERMLVANNSFYDIQYWVFDISHRRGGYGGSIEGLRIVNNIAVTRGAKIYGLGTALPASVVIDNNLVQNLAGGYIGSVPGKGSTRSLATFRSWTGREASGMQADPRFVDLRRHDFRLRADSPAVDTGRHVSGVTNGFAGDRPDRGRHERG
jgi:parallel beta-helix repeat protein